MNDFVHVEGLTLRIDRTPILRGVDLSLPPGSALGLVGESGSGKSMTLRAIADLLPDGAQARGSITVGGTDVLTLRRSARRRYRQSIGLVFQDPRSAVNPVHTVGAFLLERARDRGDDLAAATERAHEVLARMGVGEPARRMTQYPFELSGGLLQRIMIASVMLERPALLLADEPTTALDVTTQADVLRLINEVRLATATPMIFVTHDLDLAGAICDRIAVMYAGRVLEEGPADQVTRDPVHPYTRALLAARPLLTRRQASIPVIPGSARSAGQAGPGCAFAARCPVAQARCTQEAPGPTSLGTALAHCHRAHEIARGDLDSHLPAGRHADE